MNGIQLNHPLLNVSRQGIYGLVTVSPKLYDPCALMAKSKLLKTRKLYDAFQRAIFALWQIKETKTPSLIKQLILKRNQSELSEKDFKDQLRWLVQHCRSYFQLHWISVKCICIVWHFSCISFVF